MRTRPLFVAALVIGLVFGVLPGVGLPSANAYPTSTVNFEGHGWGHGRGLGQYGALGYANAGWNESQILGHYYSNTADGTIDDNAAISVRLTRFDAGADLTVTGAGATATGWGAPASAFLVRHTGSNQFTVFAGSDCAHIDFAHPSSPVTGRVTITPGSSDLTVCGTTSYHGTLVAYESAGQLRAANSTSLGLYLRGIAEVPSSWPTAALRAQAIAARSYAASGNLGSKFPDICDSTACQVYGGMAAEAAARTQAVLDTAGHVRILNGAIARTEYSSSTGGQTAGGTFPSVADEGDAVSSNPNHNWSSSVPVSTVESKFGVGTLYDVRVTERTPDDGGLRAKTVVVKGSNGTKTLSGGEFQGALGLKSTWFSIVGQSSGGINGYWVLGSDGGVFTFGNAGYYGSTGGWKLNKPVVAMAATKSGKGYWLLASDGGIFSFGDAAGKFYGSTGGWRLNAPIVGMALSPTGNGYWLLGADGGVFSFGDAAGKFYGSTGGMRLNAPVVGMLATSTGNGYWLVASDGGVFAFGDAANHFYGSMGNARLARPVIGMAARADDSGYWQSAADGGIFAFNAPYLGSLPGRGISTTSVGMRPTATGNGYLIAGIDGQVYSFGDAPVLGDVQDAIPGWGGRAIGIEVSKGA